MCISFRTLSNYSGDCFSAFYTICGCAINTKSITSLATYINSQMKQKCLSRTCAVQKVVRFSRSLLVKQWISIRYHFKLLRKILLNFNYYIYNRSRKLLKVMNNSPGFQVPRNFVENWNTRLQESWNLTQNLWTVHHHPFC